MRTKKSILGEYYFYFKRGKDHWSNVALALTFVNFIGIFRDLIPYWYAVLVLGVPVIFGAILIMGRLDVQRGILADEMKFTALKANPISAENYERLKRIEKGILALNRNSAQKDTLAQVVKTNSEDKGDLNGQI